MAANQCEVTGDRRLIEQVTARIRAIEFWPTPTSTQIDQAGATTMRAIEIQRRFQETHYGFIHAQATPYLPLLYVMDILAEMAGHQRKKGGHFARFPKDSPFPVQVERRIYLHDSMDDHHYRTQLISVSPRIADEDSTQNGESALAFLVQNRNVANARTMPWTGVLEQIFKDFKATTEVPVQDLVFTQVSSKVAAICSLLSEYKTAGNLLVIAIPKGMVHEAAYRSHPYGRPCKCHDASQDIPILDALQEASFPPYLECSDQTSYRGSRPTPTPQYRLLTSQLTRPGVEIRLVSPLRKPVKRALKEMVGQALAPLFETRF